jgi:hypothetical protein
VYGKTKGEVRQKLTEGLADRDKGLTYDGDTVSLQEHLDRWLETSVKGSVKPITYEAYERMCRIYQAVYWQGEAIQVDAGAGTRVLSG